MELRFLPVQVTGFCVVKCMKRFSQIALFCSMIFFSGLSATTQFTNANEITEEWLTTVGASVGYTDHIAHFRRLFRKMHVRGFLEFGLGYSTKYFIDNCDHVISAEFVTPGTGPAWIQYCQRLFRYCKNWTSIAYFSGEGVDTRWATSKYIGLNSVYNAAAYQTVTHKNYALIDSSYLNDLSSFIKKQVEANVIDVGFVDAGIYIRGDMVQQLFQKVPIIVAHDFPPQPSLREDNVYGYGRVKTPENYVQIHIPFGVGTEFWIKNDPKYAAIIEDLQDYVRTR